jgi:hypothetical protein
VGFAEAGEGRGRAATAALAGGKTGVVGLRIGSAATGWVGQTALRPEGTAGRIAWQGRRNAGIATHALVVRHAPRRALVGTHKGAGASRAREAIARLGDRGRATTCAVAAGIAHVAVRATGGATQGGAVGISAGGVLSIAIACTSSRAAAGLARRGRAIDQHTLTAGTGLTRAGAGGSGVLPSASCVAGLRLRARAALFVAWDAGARACSGAAGVGAQRARILPVASRVAGLRLGQVALRLARLTNACAGARCCKRSHTPCRDLARCRSSRTLAVERRCNPRRWVYTSHCTCRRYKRRRNRPRRCFPRSR